VFAEPWQAQAFGQSNSRNTDISRGRNGQPPWPLSYKLPPPAANRTTAPVTTSIGLLHWSASSQPRG
jgi:hypothetical protein